MSYFLGFDVGSSSVKAAVWDSDSGKVLAQASAPATEMEINSPSPGFAEQSPDDWWENCKLALQEIKKNLDLKKIQAVGISYQMHGLVVLDSNGEVLYPSIILCDSRAVPYGAKAEDQIGKEKCFQQLLNSPGNFTACKLAWVKENQPEVFKKIKYFCLPGDYIAFKLTGEISTTVSGLSEMMLFDFQEKSVAKVLSDHLEITNLIPKVYNNFEVAGKIKAEVARELGLNPELLISYRAGDQPNNAFSLNVLHAGEVAATAGTSGVVYGVSNQASPDLDSRVNIFAHVNYTSADPVYGTLLCINGCGILNRWAKDLFKTNYQEMNHLAGTAQIGAQGLKILPYGNGAERSLKNANLGASFLQLDFNRHSNADIFRAIQEGIACALTFGFEVMQKVGVNSRTVRAGQANLFLSPIFREAFVNLTGVTLELYNTDGSVGAARGAAIGAKQADFGSAFNGLDLIEKVEPTKQKQLLYAEVFENWKKELDRKCSDRF